ncbi:MAG TPA: molybdate ABC transporter substrate-binding protein [Nocardioides sp.]|nr:molybdate ABC transporter substrate-binding protein [Nocardioides sp.]
MRRLLIPALLALVAPLAACGSDDDSGSGDTTLTVYAAASLTATFEKIADEFEAAHDGVDVKLSFGGSSDLVAQIQNGAPADVFASADTENMDKLVEAGMADGDPQDFATNVPEIAVPPGNPAGVRSFQDLAGQDVKVVVCAPEVPCGAATQEVADKAGVTLHPVSEEQSVTDVLGKVASGEADAGVVYVTDVRAAGDQVEGIELPESDQVVNTYPIVAVEGTDAPDPAQEFLDLVLGDTGQQILRDAGFGRP